MRFGSVGLVIIAMTLAGCSQNESAAGMSGSKSKGRYAGIGTFEPGRLWAELAGTPDPSDPAAARLDDDEQIIVVIDSQTGEVRQCGNHSGFCVTIDPWGRAGTRSSAPVRLNRHAADLAAEDQAAAADEADPAAGQNAATP